MLGGSWRLTVDDAYVLTVRRDDQGEQVLLDDMVDEDSWYPDAWSPEHRKTTLEFEAAEALADEFLEVLRLWDINWPPCSQHDEPVYHCSAEWICASSSVHGIALFGALEAPNTAELSRRTLVPRPEPPVTQGQSHRRQDLRTPIGLRSPHEGSATEHS